MPNLYILTADIGGSHITTAICNLRDKTVLPLTLARTEVLSNGSANHILDAWSTAFKSSLAACHVTVSGIGLAMPGPFDYEEGICYIKGLNKYEALYGMNIKTYLAGLMQLDPAFIRFRNDAEATIDGEVLAGAGKGHRNVMGVTLGTGFGSAHCVNGYTKDINLGSTPFKTSIADDHLSTRWFVKRYHELTGISIPGVKELVALPDKKGLVKDIFREFAANMGTFLAAAVEERSPDVLVLCGNIARSSKLFLPLLKQKLDPLNIQIARCGEEAALIGAAGLFSMNEFQVQTIYTSTQSFSTNQSEVG